LPASITIAISVAVSDASASKTTQPHEEARKAVPESEGSLESDKADDGGFGQRKRDHCLFTVAQATSGP